MRSRRSAVSKQGWSTLNTNVPPGPSAPGADQLLLVSSSDPGADAVELHRTAIDAAVTAGVGRILYTSHQGAGLDSPFKPARDHAATEHLLAESGVAWTALRNGSYAHSLNWLMGPWRETGVISIPTDGPVSWTAREDAAEGAAIILASNGAYGGLATLTASTAPTFDDVAVTASETAGRDVKMVVVGEAEWVAAQVAAGQNEFTVGSPSAYSRPHTKGASPVWTRSWPRSSVVNRAP